MRHCINAGSVGSESSAAGAGSISAGACKWRPVEDFQWSIGSSHFDLESLHMEYPPPSFRMTGLNDRNGRKAERPVLRELDFRHGVVWRRSAFRLPTHLAAKQP